MEPSAPAKFAGGSGEIHHGAYQGKAEFVFCFRKTPEPLTPLLKESTSIDTN
jgi:hypothetical protein